MAEIRIGTSGWHYKHWIGRYYPERLPSSKMLGFYEQDFDTVEINNSFYRLPPPQAVKEWRDSTPPNFIFAAKGSRFLTHMKKLKDPEAGLQKFFDHIELLEPKLGPVLFQLPPNWEVNPERLAHFLEVLPRHHRYAFEFRNPTWNTPEILQLLRSGNAAYCAFDLAGYQSPVEITADFTYLRLHGPGGKYQGTYNDETLRHWAQRIRGFPADLKTVYVYFDNDDSGYAPRDALRLRELVTESASAGGLTS
jgi:uncharacterized protein YecE (DUF72 family)